MFQLLRKSLSLITALVFLFDANVRLFALSSARKCAEKTAKELNCHHGSMLNKSKKESQNADGPLFLKCDCAKKSNLVLSSVVSFVGNSAKDMLGKLQYYLVQNTDFQFYPLNVWLAVSTPPPR